jgi:hypothetical protein
MHVLPVHVPPLVDDDADVALDDDAFVDAEPPPVDEAVVDDAEPPPDDDEPPPVEPPLLEVFPRSPLVLSAQLAAATARTKEAASGRERCREGSIYSTETRPRAPRTARSSPRARG